MIHFPRFYSPVPESDEADLVQSNIQGEQALRRSSGSVSGRDQVGSRFLSRSDRAGGGMEDTLSGALK
jgi:hypothetical protein